MRSRKQFLSVGEITRLSEEEAAGGAPSPAPPQTGHTASTTTPSSPDRPRPSAAPRLADPPSARATGNSQTPASTPAPAPPHSPSTSPSRPQSSLTAHFPQLTPSSTPPSSPRPRRPRPEPAEGACPEIPEACPEPVEAACPELVEGGGPSTPINLSAACVPGEPVEPDPDLPTAQPLDPSTSPHNAIPAQTQS